MVTAPRRADPGCPLPEHAGQIRHHRHGPDRAPNTVAAFPSRMLLSAAERSIRPSDTGFPMQIPYSTEQGIIFAKQGILSQEQGIFRARIEIIAG
jgi:hypothetical protein